MMNINIAERNNELSREVPFSFTTTAAKLSLNEADYDLLGDINVSGKAVYTGNSWRVSGVIELVKAFVCDRCLKDCQEAQRQEFSEDYVREETAAQDEEANVFSGDVLDIQTMIKDTIVAAQSISNICQPDCKGLCPVCGANLNDGDCGCDRFVPDPRMAALQQLLKK